MNTPTCRKQRGDLNQLMSGLKYMWHSQLGVLQELAEACLHHGRKYGGTPPYRHLANTATLLLWPPRYYSHLVIMATSLLWPPCYYGHLVNTATLLLWPPYYYGHLVIMATLLLLPPCYYGHLIIMATSLIQPPRYYGHFMLAWTKAQSVSNFLFNNPFYMTIPLIQSDFWGKEFHCTLSNYTHLLVWETALLSFCLSLSFCLLVNNHPVFLILSVCYCLSICLSVSQQVCLSGCPSVMLSVCQSASH